FFSLLSLLPLSSSSFPYTTLFRSWHLLLRNVGARGRITDNQLINLAGQALTAVLPLGDLTRAVLATRSSGVEFGATAATVTIQEDRKSTRLNSSHVAISYAVFCLK